MPELLVTTEGSIRFLTMNRPEKRNALNEEMISALKGALREADADGSIRAIIIWGAGKDFCSGADLASLQKIAENSYEENLEDARRLGELFGLIRRVKIPVIAAVHGRALAGGCGLATACDIVVATETARFGYPEVKIGFVAAMVMAILRQNVSEKIAFELVTQGFEFDAQTAQRYGLINRIFPEDSFAADLLEYASVYEKMSGSAVQLSKRLLYQIDAMTFDDAVEAGAKINAEARMTDDCKKGIAKFLGK